MLALTAASAVMLLLSTRRARSLAQAQMEFVAGVTHELRTPLAVIGATSQNLAEGVAASGDQVRRYGRTIHDQGWRLTQMIEQILRFAGISSGRFEIHPQPVQVPILIDEAIADSQPELTAAGCVPTLDIETGLAEVNADAPAMVHCLKNLMNNAAKHGCGAPLTVRASQEEGRVRISVEDGGPGIDPVDLPHIFKPFYRGRRAISEQIEGSGLGLSLVKKIVEAHGGTIEVSSKGGRGAQFTLKLPIAKGV